MRAPEEGGTESGRPAEEPERVRPWGRRDVDHPGPPKGSILGRPKQEPAAPPRKQSKETASDEDDGPLSETEDEAARRVHRPDAAERERIDRSEERESEMIGEKTREHLTAVREAIRGELAIDAPDYLTKVAEQAQRGELKEIIEMQDVSLAFDEPILEDVSFTAHEGETIVIVGESGTGKSTMLKLILRLLVPDAGRVLVDGEDIAHLSFDEALRVRQKMGMVFQGAALFDSMSVFENIAYPLREHTDLTEQEMEERVREKLEFVDLDADKVMTQLPAELSGGMKKRVGIARGMANNPQVMLYDEPTSGLDPLTTGTITRLIMKLQRELGVTSIVVSHDIRSAFRMASRIALLANKHVVFFGTPEEMAASDDDYIRDFLGGS